MVLNPERIEIIQPKVGAQRLPWVIKSKNPRTLKGFNSFTATNARAENLIQPLQ